MIVELPAITPFAFLIIYQFPEQCSYIKYSTGRITSDMIARIHGPENRGGPGCWVFAYSIGQGSSIYCEYKKNKEVYEGFGMHFSIPIFTK